MTWRMGDAVTVANLPPGLDAYAGYTAGRWPTYAALAKRFPATRLLSIAIAANLDADCLDIETGDATIAQAPGWVARQHARGITRPVPYTSLAGAQSLIAVMVAAGFPRRSWRLWTAHYTNVAHLCSVRCGLGFTDQADATQWTDHGGAWDESLLADDFWVAPAPTPPVPTPSPKGISRMVLGNDKNGNLIIVGKAVDNNNLLVFTQLPDGKWSVADVTDGIGTTPRAYQVD